MPEYQRRVTLHPDGTVESTESLSGGWDQKPVRPKPKKVDVPEYPAGSVTSLMPILREIFDPQGNQMEGKWLDLVNDQTMTYEDACRLLIRAKKTPELVAEALLGQDEQLMEQIGWVRYTTQQQGALKSRLADRLRIEFDHAAS